MTKFPDYDIQWGTITTESENAIKEWLKENTLNLVKETHDCKCDMNKVISEFVETVYDKLTYAGYQEGSDAALFANDPGL